MDPIEEALQNIRNSIEDIPEGDDCDTLNVCIGFVDEEARKALAALKSGELVVSGEEYQLLKQYKENREKRIKNCPIVNQAIEHGKRKDDE